MGRGAILDDRQYDDNPTNINTGNLFIRLNEYMLARGKRVLAIGLSTNWRLTSPEYVNRLAGIVQGADCFSVRDELSIEVLRQAGVDASKVTLCPDVVFGNRQLKELSHAHPSDFVLGFAPMYIQEMQDANTLILEASIGKIAQLPKDANARIKLIPFYRPGDVPCLKRLRDMCSRPELVDIDPYTPDISSSPMLGCTAIICSRYHAALVAGAMGVPFLCVYPDMHMHYKNKCVYLSRIYGCPDSFVPATSVTSEDVRSFVSGDHAPVTQAHQFYDEASQSIAELWEHVSCP